MIHTLAQDFERKDNEFCTCLIQVQGKSNGSFLVNYLSIHRIQSGFKQFPAGLNTKEHKKMNAIFFSSKVLFSFINFYECKHWIFTFLLLSDHLFYFLTNFQCTFVVYHFIFLLSIYLQITGKYTFFFNSKVFFHQIYFHFQVFRQIFSTITLVFC